MDVTVAIATYGPVSWLDQARSRAIASLDDHQFVYAHGVSLHDARNAALSLVPTEWVCFLDADDELEPGYFDAMAKGTAAVRAPAVRYVRNTTVYPAKVPKVAGHTHDCTADCLPYGNWLVVGSVVRTELVRSVGGWNDWPMYEDWDLWLRCHLAGATIEAIPEAVYRAHFRNDSRNRAPSRRLKLAAHRMIAAANNVPVPA